MREKLMGVTLNEFLNILFSLLIMGFSIYFGGYYLNENPHSVSEMKYGSKFKILAICENEYCILQEIEVDPRNLKISALNTIPMLLEIKNHGLTNNQLVVVRTDKGGYKWLQPFQLSLDSTTTNFVEKTK